MRSFISWYILIEIKVFLSRTTIGINAFNHFCLIALKKFAIDELSTCLCYIRLLWIKMFKNKIYLWEIISFCNIIERHLFYIMVNVYAYASLKLSNLERHIFNKWLHPIIKIAYLI